jgi:hypothetical protein
MQNSRIPDLDGEIPTAEKATVMGRIRQPIYNFFFRGIFAGDRGPRNAIIVYFFHRLHQECVKEFGEDPHWDETNDARFMMILARLNFTDLNQVQQRPAVGKGKTKQKEQS